MTPLSPEAVAQMVADLDLFSRCGDVGVMDRDMAIDAKAMLTAIDAHRVKIIRENENLLNTNIALAAENVTLRAERDCPIGLDSNPMICSAGSCRVCLIDRVKWYSDELATLRASEAAALERVTEWQEARKACIASSITPEQLSRLAAAEAALALTPTTDKGAAS